MVPGTYGVQFRDVFVPDDLILGDPRRQRRHLLVAPRVVADLVAGRQDPLAKRWCAGKPHADSEDGDAGVVGGAVAQDLLG